VTEQFDIINPAPERARMWVIVRANDLYTEAGNFIGCADYWIGYAWLQNVGSSLFLN
jgi:hypothetical protein